MDYLSKLRQFLQGGIKPVQNVIQQDVVKPAQSFGGNLLKYAQQDIQRTPQFQAIKQAPQVFSPAINTIAQGGLANAQLMKYATPKPLQPISQFLGGPQNPLGPMNVPMPKNFNPVNAAQKSLAGGLTTAGLVLAPGASAAGGLFNTAIKTGENLVFRKPISQGINEATGEGIKMGAMLGPIGEGAGGLVNPLASKLSSVPGLVTKPALGALKGGIEGLGYGVASGGNPAQEAKNFALFGSGSGLLGKVGESMNPRVRVGMDELIKKGEALGIKGINPRAFSMHPDDLQEAKAALDILRGQDVHGTAEDKKYALQTVQHLLDAYAPGYSMAKNAKAYKVLDYLIQTNEQLPKELKTELPGMGLVSRESKPLSLDRLKEPQAIKEPSSLQTNALFGDTQGQRKMPLQPQLKTQLEQQQTNIPLVASHDKTALRGSASENIITDAKKEIGRLSDKNEKKSLSQTAHDLYTDWIDRYHPINRLAGKAEEAGKKLGFEIRPEYNPKNTIRRFLGMGGIAEQRYESQLKPIIKEAENLKIDKGDLDVYLKARRDINLAQRGKQGSDEALATQRVQALEQKYGDSIKGIADKLYKYQDEGFKELGKDFLGEDLTNIVSNTNKDYVPFARKLDDQVDEFLGIPTKVAQQKVNPIKGIKGSDKQIYSPIESIISNTFKQRAAIEKNRVAKSIVGLQNVIPDLKFSKATREGADTITVWENGQRSYYKVGEDIARSVKGMNEESINGFLKILSAPASLLRQGATGRNIEFMFPNVVKDQFDAAINSKYGYKPGLDYVRGFAHIIKNDDVYKKWIDSGASMNFSELSGRKSVQKLFDEKKARTSLFGWLGKGLDLMGKYSEQPTRVGLFANALKKTGNESLAMMDSREGTLDFSRMGAKMKVANSIIPFLNVGVQGFDKLARSAKEDPAKFALKMGLYGAVPATMVSLYNNQFHPKEYSEIPQYVKETNFVFVSGRNADGTVSYVTIPKGNVIQYISNPIDNFISYLHKTNKQSFGEMATTFLSSGLPVIGDGASPKEVAIKTIGQNLPQAIKPITENLINKSFFKYDSKDEQAKDIVPDYLMNKAPGDRSYKFTPSAYKTIGKLTNTSPLQIQNLMEGYLAGYTKIPVNIIESLTKIGGGETPDKNQLPLLRRFIQQTYPTSSATKLTPTTSKEQVKVAQAPESSLIGQADASTGEDIKSLKATVKETGKSVVTKAGIGYVNENGNPAVINLTPPTKGDGIDAFTNQNWKYTKALEIFKADLPQSQKDQAYKQLGVKGDIEYAYKASKSNDVKTQYLLSKKLDHDQLIKKIEDTRKLSLKGDIYSSDGVIDNLVAEGKITKAEGARLKKIDYNKDGTLKTSGGTGKAKKLSLKGLKAVKLPTISLSKTTTSTYKAPTVRAPKTKKLTFKSKPLKFKKAKV